MPKLHFIKVNNLTFIHDDSEGYEEELKTLSRIKNGSQVEISIKKIRSPELHRKYFAMIAMAWKNYPEHKAAGFEKDINNFRRAMQVKAGYSTPIELEGGVLMGIPKSIAYDKLDDLGFSKLFNDVFPVLMDEVFDNDYQHPFTNFGFGNEKYLKKQKLES